MQYTFRAAVDNYEPTRNQIFGRLATQLGPDKKSDVLSFDSMAWPKDAHKALYVLDFGTHVEVRYVTGWNETSGCIFLQLFPLSVGTWQSDGRPVDMSGWMLGPRRTYHLKLKEA